MVAAFKFKMKRIGNAVGIFLVFPDGTYNQIALYTVPNDNNWRADVEFFDSLLDCYKKRYRHLV